MKNIRQLLFALSLSTVNLNPVQKLEKNKDVVPGKGPQGMPVTGRIMIHQWWLEGPYWVKRPDTGKSIPKQGARSIKKASFQPNKLETEVFHAI